MTTTSTTAFRQRVLRALSDVFHLLRPAHQRVVARMRGEDIQIVAEIPGENKTCLAYCTRAGRLVFSQRWSQELPDNLLRALAGHELFHRIARDLYPEVAHDEIWVDGMTRALDLPIDDLRAWIDFLTHA